ncbi:immunoglobulin superfamily member 2-like [Archocentrus centrarchus]|uniref:immunoglobulin superfamily member 2-like n=1 Tax=Archocentrus centrarchus TaxID=63155 RepID=UPI0011E9FBEB|nr:immunoglobulin superfamily member 2-like [Archocentrus centrarchus]
MIVLWITLLLLHRGSALIPVTTVQLGGPVTFTCLLPKTETIRRDVHWYKQSIGDTLKIIWTQKESAAPQLAPTFNDSIWKVKYDKNFCNLTILSTNQEDEGIYHCGITEWLQDTKWTGTYLLVKGNTQTSNYTVVQEKTVPSGDSMSLQCSLLAESDNKSCPGGHRVFWFREGSHTSHPRIIYSDLNRHHECENRSESQQSCVFHFSKNIDSSDAGTYHCAVATCGEILFGNGTTLAIQEISMRSQRAITVIFLLCAVLVITLIVIAALIYTIKKNNSDHCKAAVLQKNFSDPKRQQNKHTRMYSAVVFTMMKVDRSKIKDAKAAKWQKINMPVKVFGLD